MTYTYYTTEVLSSLISSPVSTNIKDLYQLADSSLTIGLEKTTYTMIYLRTAIDKDVRYLIDKKILPNINSTELWNLPEKGLELVRKGGYAYMALANLAYVITAETYAPIELCDLNEVLFRPVTILGYAGNPESPYNELLKTKYYFFCKHFNDKR